MAMFIRNAWYVAADETELTDKPLGRTILGERVAIYRQNNGELAALEDACAHRRGQLSAGKVTDRGLQCPYHGFTYEPGGKCVLAPGESRIPQLALVRSYPVARKYGMVWIWMGEPALCASTPLPTCLEPYFTDEWVHARGYHHVSGYYELLADNLLDLSHADFVHDGILGNEQRGLTGKSTTRTNVEGNTVVMSRWDYSDTPPPFVIPMLGDVDKVDWWRIMKWEPPGPMLLDVGACRASTSPESGRRLINPNFLTPETESSTHYFWTVGRSFELADPKWTEHLYTQTRRAFDQDKAVIEGQQRVIGSLDLRDMRLAGTRNDLPANRARQIVQRIWRTERSECSAHGGRAAEPDV